MSSFLIYHKHYLQAVCTVSHYRQHYHRVALGVYGKVMCSKWAVTQAVAFLILCLTACNENSSISLPEFGASVSKCYVMLHLLVPR